MTKHVQLRSDTGSPRADLVTVNEPTSSRAADLRRIAQTLALRWFSDTKGSTALSIISAERGEGRTTVAANLACIFASSGMPVLLIDADAYAPSLHMLFSLPPIENAQSCGRRVSGFANLCVVTAGDIECQDPTQFMQQSIRPLIERRRGEFSAIFVDTPAASVSNDYLVAGLASGGALAVTREGVTRKRSATRMLNECDDAGIPLVGGVMLKV